MPEALFIMPDNRVQNVLFISLLFVLALGSVSCSSGGYVITLSQQQIQEKLDEAFPIEKTYLLVFKVILLNPEVRLQEGSDRIDFRIEAATNVDINDRPFQGSGNISGEVRYDPHTGEFYFDNTWIQELSLEGLPEKYAVPLKLAASLGVREILNRRPVYTLKPGKFKHSVAKMIVKQILVENGILKITLGLNM